MTRVGKGGAIKAPHTGVLEVGGSLLLEDVLAVAWDRVPVRLSEEGRRRVERARSVVERLLTDDAPATYGVNTGFGALAEVRVQAGDLQELQHRLLRSHAVGVGEPIGCAETRAMMLLRAHVLALGYSGIRVELVELLLAMLNEGVHPRIPCKGSVGASGDLAPLAHLALVLIGEGEAEVGGEVLDGASALARVGLEPMSLAAKEGLSLINGTQGMLAFGVLALLRAERLVATADVTGAMALEALKGSSAPFDRAIIAARPHPGAIESARHLRALLADSAIARSHVNCGEVQDAYSLRCMPQVHGSARDLLAYVRSVLEIELNSATDNPLVLPDGQIKSGGNFHGQPVAAALDAATIALTDLASISERRVAQLVHPSLSRGLPPFLARESGLNSGFMMAHVTAAALVSEAKALSYPKSVDTIPTSADREDHVSMGMISARHLQVVVAHVGHILAIEGVVAAEGVRQRELSAGRGVQAAVDRLGQDVPPLVHDRALHRDFDASRALVLSGELLAVADGASEPD